MTVLATISAQEHQTLLETRYINNYFEAILLNAPGEVYEPGVTIDATFLGFELTPGSGGYFRKVIRYDNTDLAVYSDQGMGLATKAAVFPHDGSLNTMDFTHVALIRGTGNIISLDPTLISQPTAGNDGTYTGIPVTSGGSGIEATIDVIVSGSGTTFSVDIAYPGYGYGSSDTISVSNATLVSLGITTAGTGDLTAQITNVSSDFAGNLVSVAPTANAVSLSNGNEAVFYFNVKQFGYSTVAGV